MTQSTRWRLWRCRVLRLPLGLLFIYSGTIKLFELQRFANHVADFGIVFDGLVKPVALTVCVVEVILGLGLLINVRVAPAATGLMLFGFMSVLLYGMAMGLDIECGCLGSGYPMNLASQFKMDTMLLVWCTLTQWCCRKCK